MTKKKRGLKPSSIKQATIFYFVIFAIFLVVLIYSLQSIFINSFYQRMKADEAQQTATDLVAAYNDDRFSFAERAQRVASSNAIYIQIESDEESRIFRGVYDNSNDDYTYEQLAAAAREQLEESSLNSVTLTHTDEVSTRLIYAVYLNPSEADILYIITPLNPSTSTIRILKVQLIYICIISLIIALMMSIVLANRLTRPILKISESAEELSQGNYDTVFDGGEFAETEALAKTLNTASYEMQRTDFYKRDLIANVSHDLKTPLTMIKSYAEMIQDISGDNPEKRREHLNVIITETDRLNKLVTDLLSVSRLQSNQVDLTKEEFDLVEAAQDVYEAFEVLNDQDGYNIIFTGCKPSIINADIDKIKQVMTNLVSNAVKYCGEDKFIQIQLTRTNKKVRFDVIDHGEGIAADELSHVWERYYRTSANHARNVEGTGIGLSIVKGILSLHNAKYGVDSTEGEGSDFWFELDLVKK